MSPTRLESFSDAVLAIIITIMVLELHVPEHSTLDALAETLPTLLTYAISFSIIATYWNNHHHLLRNTHRIGPSIMWSNFFFLFWVSLIPFLTRWMGDFYTESLPAASYAILLAMSGIAYNILQRAIVKTGGDPDIDERIGNNAKGRVSLVLYIVAAPLAFVTPWIAYAIFVGIAAWWFIPDRRLLAKPDA